MGSGEAKKFRDQFGSAGRHGAAFWTEEKDNIGMKLLQGMGWAQGQGLGKEGQGRTAPVKQFRKKDNAGIGTQAGTRDEAYRASQELFNDVLSRLSGGDAAASDGADKAPELGSAASSVKGVLARRQISRRFCKAKMNASMDEILGRKKAEGSSSAGAGASAEKYGDEVEADELQKTSTTSVNDYFAKRRAAMGLAPAAGGGGGGGGCSGFTLDDQANFAVAQQEMAYSGRRGLGLGAAGSDDEQPQRGWGGGGGAARGAAVAPPAKQVRYTSGSWAVGATAGSAAASAGTAPEREAASLEAKAARKAERKAAKRAAAEAAPAPAPAASKAERKDEKAAKKLAKKLAKQVAQKSPTRCSPRLAAAAAAAALVPPLALDSDEKAAKKAKKAKKAQEAAAAAAAAAPDAKKEKKERKRKREVEAAAAAVAAAAADAEAERARRKAAKKLKKEAKKAR